MNEIHAKLPFDFQQPNILLNKTSTGRLSASLPAACSLFAHLRKGSIAAKEGNRVKAGGFIAAVGNSGNSIQPHFHFQLTDENNTFTAIPFRLFFQIMRESKEIRGKRNVRHAKKWSIVQGNRSGIMGLPSGPGMSVTIKRIVNQQVGKGAMPQSRGMPS